MKTKFGPILAGLCLALAIPAAARAGEDPADWTAMAAEDLAALSGGADTTELTLLDQTNLATAEGSNRQNVISNEGAGAAMINGRIDRALVANNRGSTSVMQNTGSLVNMNYQVNVNVYMH